MDKPSEKDIQHSIRMAAADHAGSFTGILRSVYMRAWYAGRKAGAAEQREKDNDNRKSP